MNNGIIFHATFTPDSSFAVSLPKGASVVKFSVVPGSPTANIYSIGGDEANLQPRNFAGLHNDEAVPNHSSYLDTLEFQKGVIWHIFEQ